MQLGAYEIKGELGSGSFGRVYRARHAVLEREVALKVFENPHDGDEEGWRKRLAREARAAAKLEHPNIARVYEVFETDGKPCIAFELIRGRTLRDRLAAGPFASDEALALVEKVARAVHFAHERDIIHRDLKPSNILLDEKGEPHLVDFGIAKDLRDPRAFLSEWGAVVGTPDYVAPEQALGENETLDARVDVWALGVILYELLAGRSPFHRETVVQVLNAIMNEEPAPPTRRDGSSVGRAGEIALSALAKDREKRPRSARDFADACSGARRDAPRSSGARGGIVIVVAALVAAAGVAIAVGARSPASGNAGKPPPPLVPSVADARRLPDGLRSAGRIAPASDGNEVPVYFWALPDGTDMELVEVPRGEFKMGSDDADALPREKPAHVHPLDHAFWIGRNDVSWKQYLAFCKATDAPVPPRPEWAGIDHPVVNVTWRQAHAYCAWAKLVLPTEVEWEKAARGTDGREYPWGDAWPSPFSNSADKNAPPKRGGRELLRDPTIDDGWAYTSPVGSYPKGASPYGALDMAGNCWQWCLEPYDASAYARYAKGDYTPASSGKGRVQRGGSWAELTRTSRSSYRVEQGPDVRGDDGGFRVLLRAGDR